MPEQTTDLESLALDVLIPAGIVREITSRDELILTDDPEKIAKLELYKKELDEIAFNPSDSRNYERFRDLIRKDEALHDGFIRRGGKVVPHRTYEALIESTDGDIDYILERVRKERVNSVKK